MVNEVYITDPGTRIIVRKGSVIIIGKDGNKQVLPPNTEEVIIATSRASITTKAIGILAMKGINLVLLNSFGDPVVTMLPPVINKTVMTRVKQYELFLNHELRLELARRLIACKIENQARLVRYFAKSRREPALNDIAYSISSMTTQLISMETSKLNPEVIEGIEAQAANKYWDVVASLLPSQLGFHGRDPEGTDPVNLALNYGYGILYSTMERYLIMAGLDPYLGVLHTIKSGKPSLVFDTVEVFRPVAVDKALIIDADNIKLSIINGFLDYDSRKAVARLILNNLNRDYINPRTSRKSSLTEIMKHEAWYLASMIRDGNVKDYECFTWVF
ncbi:CRISPR-associated endonuclease Cas1 [Vulcanisaeta souniana]|nr:CRISPR-associated endonuclease Cas1 [Vulcanisaeta souniana]GGI75937.1 CRISPR-associated endonuclease Cas1 [Vulcanisaeta souniana JCM 11219]